MQNHQNTKDMLGDVLRELDARRGDWVSISAASRVPYHTLTKIAQRNVVNPRIKTVQALANYFTANPITRLGRAS